ncbi:hypothetical protein [Tistlia consotensis]|uniref:Uncharacterized protein n=1 Tax=Tistlia consotensis USBA 355 TaxID=560819 RepID=A0A1Y6BAH4_9PROT|nr:hypothetical protein [Tistlia consotensis]SMF00107.1 hypothetical protein SAMN05428998_102319 [Tistlia consotensis USBA 355]
MAKPKREDDKPNKSQKERFIETARELEVDESEEAFERAFKKIVPSKIKNPTAD